MVLDYYGIHQPEQILRQRCKTKFLGTHPINVVTAAREYGLDSYADVADLPKLAELLKQNIPPIVTTFDEEEDTIISHALVIQKIDKKYVSVLDPEAGEKQMSKTEFEKLWAAAGRLVIAVKRK
jgi:ABC-type bacteriocin/lantibiotic exporter with double-glycine peptidase domain